MEPTRRSSSFAELNEGKMLWRLNGVASLSILQLNTPWMACSRCVGTVWNFVRVFAWFLEIIDRHSMKCFSVLVVFHSFHRCAALS